MGKGIEAARAAGAGLHADVLDDFKDQLLIALVNKLSRMQGADDVRVKVSEVDATGRYNLAFRVDTDARGGPEFVFTIQRKQ